MATRSKTKLGNTREDQLNPIREQAPPMNQTPVLERIGIGPEDARVTIEVNQYKYTD